ncbi:unnamed protein product [Spirodela intermedia]|uniref:L-lactate dehydrogenase n=1 Tax=Spirodela intermedia TaxID=51605 RepID=A0A7I8IZ89_SPIIN|nr:unnamed protein product [Spirodela intermedia]CAA6663305.1 unnamed protein product [Spirodela intermedia]
MKRESSLTELGLALDVSRSVVKPIHDAAPSPKVKRRTKVSVIGVGNVGMAIAQTILTQDLADELALVDCNADKLRGEMLDLQHAAGFLPGTRIVASTDYAVTAGSDVYVVTAGARQIPGESRLDLVHRNVELFRSIVPPLARMSPTLEALRLPSNRVIGSGTNLDSSRFRFLLADHLDVNAQDVQAYMVGEHGDTSVALWSSISVGGVPVVEYERGMLEKIRKAVVDCAYEVIRLKGYTSWAIGYSVASLVRTLLRDQRRIHPVFLSLPAQLGRGGVLGVVSVQVTEMEAARLRQSAETLWEVQSHLGL